MGRLRITIAGGLAVVSIAAILLAALKSGANDWFKLVYTATFVSLIYAAVAARYRGPYWYGHAVAGWAVFLVGFGAWIDGPASGPSQRVVNRSLLTHIVPELVPFVLGVSGGGLSGSASARENVRANREGIAHCGVTLICAALGGIGARRMAARHAHP